MFSVFLFFFFFFNDTATTEIYTLSLQRRSSDLDIRSHHAPRRGFGGPGPVKRNHLDRKSTRLNSSHLVISYAVFCLKKKTQPANIILSSRRRARSRRARNKRAAPERCGYTPPPSGGPAQADNPHPPFFFFFRGRGAPRSSLSPPPAPFRV